MSSIKKNFIANFVGKIGTTALSFVFLPYYIKLMGFEAYGLVGIYTIFLALSNIFDLGLGSSMAREMARMSSKTTPSKDFRDLTRTLEWIYWITAALITTVIFCAAPFLSHHWIHAQQLPPEMIKQAIYCMGIALGFLWPSFLYIGGLIGLQKQVALNGIQIVIAVIRGVGMLGILTYISPTIHSFFLWQIFVNFIQTALTAIFLWKNLPKSQVFPKFDKAILKRLKSYAMGITGITLIGMICIQWDKMFLSHILSLETFGYYTFASTVAWTLSHLSVPIYSVFSPRFTQLIYLNDSEQLKHMYHVSCQLMSAFVIPTALFIIFFSSELIQLWTQSIEVVGKTSLLVKLLMIGMMFNALSLLPTALQYAYGWTRLSFYLNLLYLILMIPSMYGITLHFGVEGVACLGIVMNAGLLFLSIQRMHRRIIKEEKWRWLMEDVGIPLMASSIVIGISRWLFPKQHLNLILTVALLGGIYLLSLLIALLSSSHARDRLRKKWPRLLTLKPDSLKTGM